MLNFIIDDNQVFIYRVSEEQNGTVKTGTLVELNELTDLEIADARFWFNFKTLESTRELIQEFNNKLTEQEELRKPLYVRFTVVVRDSEKPISIVRNLKEKNIPISERELSNNIAHFINSIKKGFIVENEFGEYFSFNPDHVVAVRAVPRTTLFYSERERLNGR